MPKPETTEGLVASPEATTVDLKPTVASPPKTTTGGNLLRLLADKLTTTTGEVFADAYGQAQAVDDLVAAIECQDDVEAARLAAVVRG